MPETLSQSQIDELLARLRAGASIEEEPQKKDKAKKYDFSSPKRITKDQIKSLENLYENYARVLSSYFTSILRSVQEVTISNIEEKQYYEFSNSLPDNIFVGLVDYGIEDSKIDVATMMIELSQRMCFTIVERLLGNLEGVEVFDRPYTEIEIALLRNVAEHVTHYLQDAWQRYFKLKTDLKSVETNGRLLQVYGPQDIIIIISVEVKSDSGSSDMNICMPAENLEKIIDTFNGKYAHSTKRQDPEKEREKRDKVMQEIERSSLVMKAELDHCQMTLGEIAQLQVNDVISLEKRIDGDIIVSVEDMPWYTAKLGEVGKKKAFKIVDIIAKPNGGNEDE